jgi:hypothetical protein
MRKIKTLLTTLLLASATLWAIPNQMTFQGTVKQGNVPINGTKNMQFSFVDSSGATIPGTSPVAMANVPIKNGLFSVSLPMDPTVAWDKVQPFIQVSVEGQTLNNNQPINTNAYSMVANTVVDGAITYQKLAASVQSVTIPPGVVVPYTGSTAPVGWLLCDGSAVSRTAYSALFNVIGINHGSGDGTSTFNLPDYRGRFLRGQDQGTGRDPNAGTRGAMNAGGNVGDAIGSVEGSATALPANPFATSPSGAHTHQYLRPARTGGDQSGSNWVPWVIAADQYGTTGQPEGAADGAHTHTIDKGGDSETRPVNAAVNFIVKD